MIEVRRATPEEYPAVGELTARAYLAEGALPADDPYYDLLRDSAGRAADAELWVAVDGPELLGTVTRCPRDSRYRELGGPDEGEFRALAVAPEARGRGVGALLVETCLDRDATDGFTQVVISTADWMTSAHRLYRRLGFVRAPDRDWSPRDGISLLAFVRPLP